MTRQLHEQKDSVINAIEAQRNLALNQVAQMYMVIDDMKAQYQSDIHDATAESVALRAEIKALKARKGKKK